MNLTQLITQRQKLYKELNTVREQIRKEKYRQFVQQSKKVTIEQDIIRWLKSRSGLKREALDQYTTKQAYQRYIKNTRRYPNISPIRFNKTMRLLGFSIKTVRKNQSVERIFYINH